MRPARALTVALSLAALAVLAGCGTGGPADAPVAPSAPAAPADRSAPPAAPLVPPTRVGTPAPAAQVDPAMLPSTYQGGAAVAPGWSEAPQEAAGVFVGRGGDDGAGAAIVAVDDAGTLLWRAHGPEETRVVLTRPEGRPLAVLSAPGPDGTWSAGAFDLTTGEPVWGPTALAGPPTGHGLVVTTPSGLAAVDARTGDPAMVSAQVVAERDGVVVTVAGGALRGEQGGTTLWTTPLADLDLGAGATPVVVPDATPPPGTLVLGDGSDGRPRTGTLVDLRSGTAIATDVRDARADTVLGRWVVLGATTLSAHDGATPLWSRPTPDGAELAAVDRVLAYLRFDDAVLVVNTATGADAEAYDPAGPAGLAVPAVAGGTGAALRTDRWVLLTAGAP